MGCFSCLDSREDEKMNPNSQQETHDHDFNPTDPCNIISRLPSAPGAEKLQLLQSHGVQTFTFRELAAATKNFRPESILEDGRFERAFKGRLQTTARLSDQKPLDWNTRMKIAAGAAKGLEYLHDKANPPVIHRDFKSSNILLDEGYHPKLPEFGLAKGPVGDNAHVFNHDLGTCGYHAPEYAKTGQLNVKSDVYSFGVVLLELITGRKAIDSTRPSKEQNLVTWEVSKVSRSTAAGAVSHAGSLPSSTCGIIVLAKARPLIGEVAIVLSLLANQAYDHNNAGDDKRNRDDKDGRLLKNEEGGISGHRWDLEGSEKDDSSGETARMLNNGDLDRQCVVAEL